MINKDDENKPSFFEEVRVIETDDGLKWVNIDDLIMSLHYSKDLMDKDLDKELEECNNEDQIKELVLMKEIFGASNDDLVEALEGMITDFNDLNEREENEEV